MKKFKVTMYRTNYDKGEIIIEAESKDDAWDKGEDLLFEDNDFIDWDYGHSTEEEVDRVLEIYENGDEKVGE